MDEGREQGYRTRLIDMVGFGNIERAGKHSNFATRSPEPRQRMDSANNLLPRCLWGLMAASHAPALVNVWQSFIAGGFDVARLGGCIALSLAMVFFGLKMYGVTFLHIPSRPRSWVAMSLIVVLVHLDVLSPHPHTSVVPQCLTLVTSVICVAIAVRLSRELMRILRRACTLLNCQFHMTRSTETVWFDAFRPHCWVRAARLYALRAPPV